MARPPSWIGRLSNIRRMVENSQQSHYGRADFQRVFELQPRAAGDLLDLMPLVAMWGAQAVTRDSLVDFLEQVRLAEDVPALYARLREEKENISRKKPRYLVRDDHEPLPMGSLPNWVRLSPGCVEIRFETVAQLVEGIIFLFRCCLHDARILEFCRLYEPAPPAVAEAAHELEYLPPLSDEEAERIIRGPGGWREFLRHRSWGEEIPAHEQRRLRT
jgi:hypothetical protein